MSHYPALAESPSAVWGRYQEYAAQFVEQHIDVLNLVNPVAFIHSLCQKLNEGMRYTNDLALHFTETALKSNDHNCVTFALLVLACYQEVFGEQAPAMLFQEITIGNETQPKDAHALLCIACNQFNTAINFFAAIDTVNRKQKPFDAVVIDYSSDGITINTRHKYFVNNVEGMQPQRMIDYRQRVYKQYLSKKRNEYERNERKRAKKAASTR